MTTTELERNAGAEAVGWARAELNLAYTEIGHAVEADERTVRRWAGREISPRGRHREKLEELRELRHLLNEVFDSPEQADEWLHSSVRAFRGRTPLALIRAGKVQEVNGVLATIESGAYL
jgi:ribosome-binding protein aMBF1 (putative translation factor)